MRAHEVHKGCRQVGGTTGTGVLWRYSVPSWGVTWSTCCGWREVINVPWSTCHGQHAVAVSCLCLVKTPNHLIHKWRLRLKCNFISIQRRRSKTAVCLTKDIHYLSSFSDLGSLRVGGLGRSAPLCSNKVLSFYNINNKLMGSNHQTANLVFPNFFHEYFSIWAVEKEN